MVINNIYSSILLL